MHFITTNIRELRETFIGPVTAHSIALGFMIGSAIALLPTFGFAILIIVGLILLFPNINKPAALMAAAFWNPLMLIPVYSVSLAVGSFLFDAAPVVNYDITVLDHIYTFTRRFLVGNLITTITLSLASYVIVFTLAKTYLFKKSRDINAQVDVTR